ncbi:MAG: hypothetical protein KQH53_07785 [Desulfarculaceae bacterium]|nr:hypothetical protein [Desulfarculaceae bacterium]
MVDEHQDTGIDPFWEKYLEGEIRPQITTILKIVKEKIIPIFKQAEVEADEVSDRAWYAEGYSENADPGSMADYAMEMGLDHYSLLTNLTYGILNLFSVHLYHLYEQHLVYLCMHELIHPATFPDPHSLNATIVNQMLTDKGIETFSFKTYPKIKELKYVCNCVKHGDGRSCEEVKKLRPVLFEHPSFRGQDIPSLPPGPIITPLAGDSLWISEQDFEEYAQAVLSFFEELFQTNRKLREEAGYPIYN